MRGGALVLAAVLVVSGCSSDEVTEGRGEPVATSTTGEASPGTPTTGPASGGAPDLAQVCALVTAGELEALAGTPVTDGVVQDSGWGSQECRFETEDGVPGNGSVTLAVASGVRDGVELWPTPLVSGFLVGTYEADWDQQAGLVVVVDDEEVPWLLHTLVRLDQRNDRARSVELAETVVSRLPLMRDGQRVCSLFRADDFEAVFGSRTSDRPPRVLTAPVVLGECLLSSLDGSDRLELGAYVVDLPGVGELAPVETLSRRVASLGPGAWWHRRSGVSIDLAGQHVVWLRVAATSSALHPDRSLSIAAARVVLDRLDLPKAPPG